MFTMQFKNETEQYRLFNTYDTYFLKKGKHVQGQQLKQKVKVERMLAEFIMRI